MNSRNQSLFETYLYKTIPPYTINTSAIKNSQCFEFAKKIVDLHDDFYCENRNPRQHEIEQHLRNVLKLLLTELDDNSQIVKNIKKYIANLKSEPHAFDNTHGYYDDLLRVRTVFDLFNLNVEGVKNDNKRSEH